MSRSTPATLLGSVFVLALALPLLPSCGSSGGGSAFAVKPDGGQNADGPVAQLDGSLGHLEGSVGRLGGDTGTGMRTEQHDFGAPVLDTGVPANAPALFAGKAADAGALAGPCLYDPEIGTLFPNNWLRPRFRFSASNGENLFQITLIVPYESSPLVIYTTASGYTLDAARWKIVTSVGVGTVKVSIRSAVVAGGVVTAGPFQGTEGTFEIAPVSAAGSVVYWTTSNGTVLKGFKIGQESVQSVITPAQVSGSPDCVACHTSTPDGNYVALTATPNGDGTSPAYLDIRSVDGKATQPPYLTPSAQALLARANQHAATFSKSHWSAGDYTMLSMFYAANPTTQAVDSEIIWTDLAATSQTEGAAWGVLPRTGDPNQASSAAFSHDGTKVAYVSTPAGAAGGAGIIETAGGIWTVPYANRLGGAATQVAGANDTAYTQYYPIFSADDEYLAFNRVPTGSTSYNDDAAEVFVIPSKGGTATRLAANDPPACLGVKSPGITNSWPKWSPEIATSGQSSYYFLVFSSTRDPGAMGGPQLYVAPILVKGSTVTTYSALYFWNQPETEHNHTPAWDVFALPPPPAPP
jgi:hypothetical protein